MDGLDCPMVLQWSAHEIDRVPLTAWCLVLRRLGACRAGSAGWSRKWLADVDFDLVAYRPEVFDALPAGLSSGQTW
jgi:hypothetical protein